jgi:NAD(P)-dependent dehydrogenase (short-subunit alcohol dehydrogenase family)
MANAQDLSAHVALVTGASRGIGAAIALTLAESGAAVAVNYRERAGDAEAVVARIKSNGGRTIAVAADVSQSAAVTGMVERVARELGPIDILVNNAGIAIVRGVLYVACQRGARVYREVISGDSLTNVQELFRGTYGRIRTVEPSVDGNLWMSTTNNGDKDSTANNSDEKIFKVILGN